MYSGRAKVCEIWLVSSLLFGTYVCCSDSVCATLDVKLNKQSIGQNLRSYWDSADIADMTDLFSPLGTGNSI